MTSTNNYSPPQSRVDDNKVAPALEPQTAGVKFFAAILIVGGVCGLGISALMGYTFVQQHWAYGLLVAGFIALFVWSGLTGVRLWRGDPSGLKWAKILFGLQIPVITIPGFSYEYFTGISVKLMTGNETTLGMNLGAGTELYLNTSTTGFVAGINVFAMVALAYLSFKRRLNEPGYE